MKDRTTSGAAIDSAIADGAQSWLRGKGFRRRGRCFFRTASETIHAVSFQAGRFNTPEKAVLALNLGVEWPELHVSWTGRPIGSNPALAPTFVQSRLHPERGWGSDFWWQVMPQANDRPVGKLLLEALEKHADAFWNRFERLDRVLVEIETGNVVPCGSPRWFVKAALLVRFNRLEEARHELANALREAPPGFNVAIIAERLGVHATPA